MSGSHQDLMFELAIFADLGTDPPKLVESGSDIIVRMTREGEALELIFHDKGKGKIIEKSEMDGLIVHASYRALLASRRFGDLRRWANSQYDVLTHDPNLAGDLLPPEGQLSTGQPIQSVEELDQFLFETPRKSNLSTDILLINGPAGIGKTVLIQQLARLRAKNAALSQRALLLHVQSRGRVLNNIQDLMAFSLQTLRLRVTYDQVPILVKHGLVALAVDGFDELGDPNGYDVAWTQINELVNYIRGQGTLILSGRETFIGKERLMADVQAIRQGVDVVEELSLRMTTERSARAWLARKGWDETLLSNRIIDTLLEEGSYALRPFFLMLLADRTLSITADNLSSGFLLQMLIDQIIYREAGKFGAAVDAAMPPKERRRFIEQFMCEVARDMSDSQTEAIEETSLAWLVEASLSSVNPPVPGEVANILKNRANVIAFLTRDERPNYRRFSHAQIQSYFLSEVTISTVGGDEIPKYIRRNILGPESLYVFGEFVTDLASRKPEEVVRFLRGALKAIDGYSGFDRGARNLGSLLFACLPVSDLIGEMTIANVDVDDAVIQGNVAPARIVQVTVNQLDIRGANLELLEFARTQVVSLILDQSTRVSRSFPEPAYVTDDTRKDPRVMTHANEIKKLLDEHGRAPSEVESGVNLVSQAMRDHGLYKLLDKVCRLKQYWIKSTGDERGGKFVSSEWWPRLYALLVDHDLIRVQSSLGAGGRPGEFYHIKQPARILAADPNDTEIACFYHHLASVIREVPDET